MVHFTELTRVAPCITMIVGGGIRMKDLWPRKQRGRAAHRSADGVPPARTTADGEPLGPSVQLATRLNRAEAFEAVVGRGPAMRDLMARVRKVAQSRAPLLLCGEAGSGKRAIAQLIHELSPRVDMAFVRLDCAAVSAAVLESELLGVKRGAFAGAERDREGLLQTAHRGTLLLENVSEIGAAFQPKLQNILDDILDKGEYHRVGDRWGTRRSDVRVIATTCSSLGEAVAHGRFRRGLCDRLGVISLAVPSLRTHSEDVLPLLEHFGEVLSQGRGFSFDAEALEVLRRYSWPGNVRELQNAVECAFVLGGGARAKLEDLPVAIRAFAGRGDARLDPREADRGESYEAIERRCIAQAMKKTGADRGEITRLLVTRPREGSRQPLARVLNLLG